VALDTAGRILLWNHAAEGILGYAADEVIGRTCWHVFAGRGEDGNLSCHPHCHVLEMARRHEAVRAYNLLTHRKDGSDLWINISTLQIPATGGDVIVRLFRDVTQHHHVMTVLQNHLSHPVTAGPDGSAPVGASLSPRERGVLRRIAQGRDTQEIADELGIHAVTVRNHIQRILSKLGVHSRLEAVVVAFRSGWV